VPKNRAPLPRLKPLGLAFLNRATSYKPTSTAGSRWLFAKLNWQE